MKQKREALIDAALCLVLAVACALAVNSCSTNRYDDRILSRENRQR